MWRPKEPYRLWNECTLPIQETAWSEFARRVIAFATLAPSAHNTQPWKFRIRGTDSPRAKVYPELAEGRGSFESRRTIELLPDERRHLGAGDPTHRQFFLSIGAALENMLIVARAHGYRPQIIRTSDVLSVIFGDRDSQDVTSVALAAAITKRRTLRAPFTPQPLSSALIEQLAAVQREPDTQCIEVQDRRRIAQIADLAAAATRSAFSASEFRRELSHWLRNNFTRSGDGMPCFTNGIPDLLSFFGPSAIRWINVGNKQAKDEYIWITSSPLLLVVATPDDLPDQWIRAGQTLERTLLTATACGIASSIIEAPIEMTHFRAAFSAAAGVPNNLQSQALIRFGYTTAIPHPTPRRNISDVIVPVL